MLCHSHYHYCSSSDVSSVVLVKDQIDVQLCSSSFHGKGVLVMFVLLAVSKSFPWELIKFSTDCGSRFCISLRAYHDARSTYLFMVLFLVLSHMVLKHPSMPSRFGGVIFQPHKSCSHRPALMIEAKSSQHKKNTVHSLADLCFA